MIFYNYRVKRKRKYRRRRITPPRHHSHKDKHRKGSRVILTIIGVLLILVLAGTGVYFYMRSSGLSSLMKNASGKLPEISSCDLQENAQKDKDGDASTAEGNEATGEYEAADEVGIVRRDGKKYRYNENIINILCMGIDRSTDMTELKEVSGESGQADTIFLLSLDPDKKEMQLIGISRDTMTDIKTFDYHGNYLGESRNHLGLAFAFENEEQSGGSLVAEAVSELFYGLPIHGYAAVNMNAIEKLNNAVGGVKVTLPEDCTLAGRGYPKGVSVTLTGQEAESFIRYRNMEQEGSNNLRMARQKQYALSFISTAKSAIKQDISLPVTLYQELTSDMSTSIQMDEAVYLASLLLELDFNGDNIRMLEGTTKQAQPYEEFYIDEEALKDLIVETFYTEVK